MSQSPEEIRADIERTRARLGTDVDAVAEKASPSNIVHRQTDKVKDSVGRAKDKVMGAKDSVMGAKHDASGSTRSMAHDAGEAVSEAPHQIARKTEGNPLAAGLIAFGAGWLVSSLFPASKVEQQAAEKVKEQAQPLVDEVKSSAQQVAQDMKEPAREAAEDLKTSAKESAEHVKAEGQTAAQDVKDRADTARQHVQEPPAGRV